MDVYYLNCLLCNILSTTLLGNHLHVVEVSGTEHRSVLRKRTATFRFTERQLSVLNKRFKSDPYISGKEKELMAEVFGVTQATIRNWFSTKRKQMRKSVNTARNPTVELPDMES